MDATSEPPAPAAPPAAATLVAHAATHRTLIALLVVAVAIRLGGIGDWWLNPDEGIYFSTMTRDTFAGFWEEVTANAHPPLYYLLLRAMGVVTWDFVVFRGFSLVAGLAAIVSVWAVARKLTGPGQVGAVACAVAGLLMVLAPGAVEQSQVMRPYMLQAALLGGALYALLRYLDQGRGLVAYLALVLLALLTHYSSVLALGAFGLIVLHDGFSRGTDRKEWRTLLLAHAVPALALATIYLVHLRPLMASALADEALDGWLEPYMIGSPRQGWLAFLGFQHLLAPAWLRGPLALLTLAVLLAGARDRSTRRVAVVLGAGIMVAAGAASLGVYPFGSTRHSAWLLVFVVPALGWGFAHMLSAPLRVGLMRTAALLTLLLVGGSVGQAIGTDAAPWSPSDQVIRRASVVQMLDLLDPDGTPELIVMGAQTFYLLVPFYAAERELAEHSPDGALFHFPLGTRRVLVSESWDFSFASGGAGAHDLGEALTRADRAFPDLGIGEAEQAVLITGGWRPPLLDELLRASGEFPFIQGQRSEPGLWAFLLDLPAFREAAAQR